MKFDITKIRKEVNRLKAKKENLELEFSDLNIKVNELSNSLSDYERARDIVNDVMSITQGQVKEYLEEVVSLALSSVYGYEYEFCIDFEIKRNQTEVSFWYLKNGEKFDPMTEDGGGPLDVASLALRLGVYSLMNPKPMPLFILDEPGKHSVLSHSDFGKMLQKLSEMLNLQIIMVSHSKEIMNEITNGKGFMVTQTRGISTVKEM